MTQNGQPPPRREAKEQTSVPTVSDVLERAQTFFFQARDHYEQYPYVWASYAFTFGKCQVSPSCPVNLLSNTRQVLFSRLLWVFEKRRNPCKFLIVFTCNHFCLTASAVEQESGSPVLHVD